MKPVHALYVDHATGSYPKSVDSEDVAQILNQLIKVVLTYGLTMGSMSLFSNLNVSPSTDGLNLDT